MGGAFGAASVPALSPCPVSGRDATNSTLPQPPLSVPTLTALPPRRGGVRATRCLPDSIAHCFNRDRVCYHLRTSNFGVLPFRHDGPTADGRRPIWQASQRRATVVTTSPLPRVSLSLPLIAATACTSPELFTLPFLPCQCQARDKRQQPLQRSRRGGGPPRAPSLSSHPRPRPTPPHPRSPPHSLHHQSTTALLPRRPEQNTEWPRPRPRGIGRATVYQHSAIHRRPSWLPSTDSVCCSLSPIALAPTW